MYKTFLKLLNISYKNLFRNKRRTVFTFLIAVIGFVAMGLAAGYYSYSVYGLQELTIALGFTGDGGTNHTMILDKRSLSEEEEKSMEFGIVDYNKLISILEPNDYIDFVIPRVKYGGLVSNGEKSLPFNGIGLDVSKEAELRDGLKKISAEMDYGEQIRPLDSLEYGVILGSGLASSLSVEKGDFLMLYGVTVDGAVNAIDVELVGITETGTEMIDKYLLISNIPVVHRLINTEKITSLTIKFNDREKLDQKINRTRLILEKNKFDQFSILSWDELGKFYTSIRDIFNVIFLFNGLIIIVIVLMSCWNIINMTTMERSREIGALRAIGLRIKYITSIFLIESFLIAIAGVVFGFIVQVSIAVLLNYLGIPMPPIPGQEGSYLLQVHSFTFLHPYIAFAIITAISLSGLSSFFIIRKLSIIELLDYA